MSYRWRRTTRHATNLAGGAFVALSGAGMAAALFPPVDVVRGAEKAPDIPPLRAVPASLPASAPASAPVAPPSPPSHGESIGDFQITFYVLSEEASHQSGAGEVALYRKDGSLIGSYPRAFVEDLKLQGSARLSSGDILAYAGSCSYGPGTCYRILSKKRYPWGQGASGRALRVMQSVASDPRVVPFGTKIYIPELDGAVFGGKTYDGCFSVDDTGGGVKGFQLDLFAGTRALGGRISKYIPDLKATVFRGGEKCGEKTIPAEETPSSAPASAPASVPASAPVASAK
jgi:3D (Asp-Asp-Asp) domain-containing protein